MQENKNIFPQFDLFPRLTKIAKTVGNLFVMHQLSPHSDHEFKHPLDEALDAPAYQEPYFYPGRDER